MVDRKPVVVCDRDGEPIEVAQTSTKGFKKSIEQGALWILDAVTDRLLPMPSAVPLLEIADRGSFYRAIVDSGYAAASDRSQPAAGHAVVGPSAGSRDSGEPLLQQLQRMVAERQRSLPEGSYTTHLFREGVEKIRKKIGEEAVELILARGDEEIVHESADLIYHMLVLLQACGLGVEAVLEQLAERMK